MIWLVLAGSAAFGAVVGSFLNVCIYRLPRDESIVSPRSFCPACRVPIAWYDNIPVVSFLVLRGRCRRCRGRIAPRYLVVELLTVALFLLVVTRFGLSPEALIYGALFASLVVVTFIDFEHQIIPDVISLGGLAVGLLLSLAYPRLHGELAHPAGLLQGVVGAVVGGGSLYLIGLLGQWWFRREAMGGGDVKLLAMLGSFMGWRGVFLTVLISAFVGSAVGLTLKFTRKIELIPYGPYLSLGAVVTVFWGAELVAWYERWILQGRAW